MVNTSKRVLSAIVLIIFVGIMVYLGKIPTYILMVLFALIAQGEILRNFIGISFNSLNFLISILLSLSCIFIVGKFMRKVIKYAELTDYAGIDIVIYLGLIINLLLIIYLIKTSVEDHFIKKLLESAPVLTTFIAVIPILSLTSVLLEDYWKTYLVLILLINYGMDTGAWLFGRTFGKHKMAPVLSPNKTMEGLFGGMFFGAGLATIYWIKYIGNFSIMVVTGFIFLCFISQLGDLIQSKIKREFQIKDSSNLIPGHGGVYDRIDSLLFIGPFFGCFLKAMG